MIVLLGATYYGNAFKHENEAQRKKSERVVWGFANLM